MKCQKHSITASVKHCTGSTRGIILVSEVRIGKKGTNASLIKI